MVSLPVVDAPCPLCGQIEGSVLLDSVADRLFDSGTTASLVRCGGCGLVRTRPWLTDAGREAFYDETYARRLEGWHSAGSERWIVDYRLDLIKRVRSLGPDDHLLEVGCHEGAFLRRAADRFGCSGTGVDLNAAAVGRAPEHPRVRLIHGELAAAELPPASFSAVCLYQVLEHVPDPVAVLAAAARLVRPDGLVVVEVPDLGATWRPLFGRDWLPLLIPQHLLHFEADTLAAVARAAGLGEVVRHQPMFVPLNLALSVGLVARRALGLSQESALLKAILLTTWLLVDVPTQLPLRLWGRTANQVLMVRPG